MTEPQLDERRRFAMIPEDMLFDPEMPAGAIKVFGILHRYGRTPDTCYPSMKLIGEKAGIGRRQVRRYIEVLESTGWLRRVPRESEVGDPDSNAYYLFSQRDGTDNSDRTPGHERPHPRSDTTPPPVVDDRTAGQNGHGVRSDLAGGCGQKRPGGAVKSDPLKRAIEREPENETPSPDGEAEVIDISTREARPPVPTFADFWAVWPRRVGKADARKAWDKKVREGHDPFEIIDGARRLAAVSTDKQFIKYPQGWLNGQRWEDEDDALPKRTEPKVEPQAPPNTAQAVGLESPW
jgi:hypothetical protein